MNDRSQSTDAYQREQRAASPGDERIVFPPHSGVWMVFARALELIDANGVRREQKSVDSTQLRCEAAQ